MTFFLFVFEIKMAVVESQSQTTVRLLCIIYLDNNVNRLYSYYTDSSIAFTSSRSFSLET